MYKLDPVPGPRYLIRVVTMQPAPPQFDLCHPRLPGLAHIVCWSHIRSAEPLLIFIVQQQLISSQTPS